MAVVALCGGAARVLVLLKSEFSKSRAALPVKKTKFYNR